MTDTRFKRIEKKKTQELISYDHSVWKDIKKELFSNKIALVSIIILLIIIIASILAPLSPYDPNKINVAEKLQGISAKHIFGTDENGRDYFTRALYGGRISLTVGFCSMIMTVILGTAIGITSGYFGGKVDMFLMRFTEIFGAIPFLPFAMILSALMAQMDISENEKIFILMVILGLLSWTGLARLVRGQILLAREQEYVTAAKAMGLRESRIAFRHILPNIVSVIFVTLTLDFATCMLTESTLSYLGFGVTYPRPTWGNMLNGANNSTVIKNFWWRWLFPAIFLAITCICINIVGDTLRDVMDPKSDRDK